MGARQNQPFQLSFNASLKIDFQGCRVTSDGGLVLVRELDERLGFGELIKEHLTDSRQGKNTQFPLADLVRQSVYSRLAGTYCGVLRESRSLRKFALVTNSLCREQGKRTMRETEVQID